MALDRRTLLKLSATVAGGTLAAPLVLRQAALGADPIKAAGIHDTSGGLDIYGQPMVACLDYAVAELNEAGGLLGRPVQLINYNPQSSIQLYTQFATQAATRDRVAVVHGGITSASREAIRPVLRRHGTLYFYNTQYEGGVCDRNVFCTGSTPAQNVDKLVPYVLSNWGKRIYVVAADYNYGQITSKWIAKYARDGGGEVLGVDFFPLDVTDFGAAINRHRHQDAGARPVRRPARDRGGAPRRPAAARRAGLAPPGRRGAATARSLPTSRTARPGCSRTESASSRNSRPWWRRVRTW